MQGDIPRLGRRHVFGMKADVKDNAHFIDEHTVVYPVGKTFVIYNQTTNTQRFIMGQEKAEAVTAMAITANKKYIAVASSGDSPSLEVFDTTTRKRRKGLNLQDLGSREFVALGFSNDCRHLVVQGGAPEWNLVFWTWDRNKSLTMVPAASNRDVAKNDRSHISCVSVNPSDPYHVCISGNGVLKFFKFADGQLKPAPGGMGKRDPQNFLCHRWLPNDDRIIVSTENGDLLLMENCEFKCVLPLSPSDGNAISTLCVYSKGFICGGDAGLISVYEQSDEKELFRKVRTIKVDPKKDNESWESDVVIKSFSLNTTEESLVVSTMANGSTNGQLFILNLTEKAEGREGKITTSRDVMLQPEYLVAPFHTGPITGIDTCIRKPLVVTCSRDQTVRVWNHLDHTLEICKHFNVEATSIAMHPSGLHILVGFVDKLRYMNLYGDDIKEFKSFNMRSCPECRFSSGGQYFAFVHGQVIQLYSTYTCEPITPLRGPTGKIKCLYWMPPDDTRLLSAGLDGAVYDWNVKDARKENDHVLKSVQYTSVVASGTHSTGLLWACGNDRKLREMEMGGLNVVNEWEVGESPLTSLAFAASYKLLFAGAEDGSVRVIATPLQNGMHQPEHTMAHSAAITRVCLTHDESILFTVGEDGCLWMFDVKEKDGRGQPKQEISYAEEILISKADLDEKNSIIQDLKQKVDELRIEMDYLARKRDIKHEEKIKEIQDQFKEDSEKQWAKFEALLALKQEQEFAFTDIRKETAEKHRQEIGKLEADYQSRIQAAEELKVRLQKQLDEEKRQFEEQVMATDLMFDKTKREMDENFQEALSVERETCEQLRVAERELRREHEEIREQLEKDTDDEIEEIKERYEKRLSTERDHFLQLKGENGIMRKKFTTLQKEITDKNEEINHLMEALQMLAHKISRVENDIDVLKSEIKDRDEAIGDKEKQIYDLKKKNQELEKFKFVLDFKIRELKSQIEPRQDEISEAKLKIKEMDGDLEKYHQNNLSLFMNIEELEKRISRQQKEIHTLSNKLKDGETYRNRVRNDLSELVQKIQEPKQLLAAVAQLYRKHVKAVVAKGPELDEGLQVEYQRQRHFLEKTVDSLKKKIIADSDGHKGSTYGIMNENVQLIKEINELRKEIKVIRGQAPAEKPPKAGSATATVSSPTGLPDTQLQRELAIQRNEMAKLSAKVAELEAALEMRRRPPSRDLPGLPRPPSGEAPNLPRPPSQHGA